MAITVQGEARGQFKIRFTGEEDVTGREVKLAEKEMVTNKLSTIVKDPMDDISMALLPKARISSQPVFMKSLMV